MLPLHTGVITPMAPMATIHATGSPNRCVSPLLPGILNDSLSTSATVQSNAIPCKAPATAADVSIVGPIGSRNDAFLPRKSISTPTPSMATQPETSGSACASMRAVSTIEEPGGSLRRMDGQSASAPARMPCPPQYNTMQPISQPEGGREVCRARDKRHDLSTQQENRTAGSDARYRLHAYKHTRTPIHTLNSPGWRMRATTPLP